MKNRRSALLLVLFPVLSCNLLGQAFVPTGSMNEPRRNHAATLLNNDLVLVTGGDSNNSTAELYNPATGTWRYTRHSMVAARENHSATLLLDRRVLIVGGSPPGSGSWLQSAEVFDPVSEGFTAVHPSNFAHSSYEPAILLNDGRVLVVGGDVGSEIYNPGTDSWSIIPSIPIGDRWSSAVKLSDGTVLAMGGDVANPGCCTTAGVYRYDPVSNTVTQMASMLIARVLHTATLLPNGQVLIAAGSDENSSYNSTELYDPSIPGGHSQFGSALNQARQEHRTVLLPNGDVLVTGGILGASDPPVFYNTAELRDHTTGHWTLTQPMSAPRNLHTATLLRSGAVLIAGGGAGSPTNSAEIWNGTSATSGFAPTGSMKEARQSHAAARLNNGSVLVTGGTPSGTAEIYDPVAGAWRYTLHPMQHARELHSMTPLSDGRALVVGGNIPGTGTALLSAEIFDPTTEQFTAVHAPNYTHGLQPAVLLNDGRVLIIGGDLGSEIYDPTTDTWAVTPAIPVGDREFPAVKLGDGTVIALGGDISNPGCCISLSVYKYTSLTNTVMQMGSMIVPRVDHTASILSNGQVVIVGGTDGSLSLSSTEIYDPLAQPNGKSQVGFSLHDARRHHVAISLPNGDVLVSGGYQAPAGGAVTAYLASGELRDHATGLWSLAGTMSTPRSGHTATLLNSGSVLFAGGGAGSPTNTADLWGTPLLQTGTILIKSNRPEATFTISPPVSGFPTGGPYPINQLIPIGTYQISFNTIAGYITPLFPPQQLSAGGNITFDAQYQPIPSLVVDQSTLSFSYQESNLAPIPSKLVNVTSSGAPINFSAVSSTIPPGGTWLSVTTSGRSTTPATLAIGVTLGLTEGRYFGQVTIRGTASNTPITIPVTLTVGPPPAATVERLDPVSSLLSDSDITTNPSMLATQGNLTGGVSADGLAQLVIRFTSLTPGVVLFSLTDANGVQLDNNGENGTLATLLGTIPLDTIHIGTKYYAFATYRAPAHFIRHYFADDVNAADRFVYIKTQFFSEQQEYLLPKSAIHIVRPPVMLVHGIYSCNTTWNTSAFEPLFFDFRFVVQTADYRDDVGGKCTASKSFASSAPVVYTQLTSALLAFKQTENVAAIQTDVVTHSMGGPVVRTMALESNFLRDPLFPTFGHGPIHTLITIAGVHLGTPLAPFILSSSCYTTVFNRKFGMPMGNGAVADLAPSSTAITNINQNHPPFPVHTIVGLADAAQKSATVSEINLGLAVQFATPECWTTIFPGFDSILGGDNDLLVPNVSQTANGAVPSSPPFHDTIHSGFPLLTVAGTHELDSTAVFNEVLNLLNTNADDTTVFKVF